VSSLPERSIKVLNAEYLNLVLEKVGNPNILVNIISRRVRQLSRDGFRPLIAETAGLGWADIALREIIDGKLSWEMIPVPEENAPSRKPRHRS
jgi:DNA-directed RNA polymerase subunit omega